MCFRIFSLIFTLTITFFTPNVASADTDACKKIKFGWYFADGEHDAINALSLKLIFPSQLPQHCAALVAAFNAHPTEGSNNIYIPANNRIVTLLETRLRSDGKQGLCAIWTEFPNKPDSKCPSGYGVDQLLPDGFIPRIYPNAETCNGPLLTTEATCGDQLTLTLTPAPNQKDPRPLKAEGKDGKSTLELIATVMEGSTPKAGVAVTFGVEVVAKSGGHGHHDASRPKGKVIASENKTDAKGEIKLTFNASDVAGSHTITATCDSCSNKFVENKVDVKVPDLAPISPNTSKNADGSSQYAFTAKDPTHIGASGGPRGEYYLTAQAATNLDVLVTNFAEEGWGTVAFNDASLVWGGLYDIENNWMPSHQGHRVGEEIDISFTRANNPISTEKRKKIYKTFCEDKKASVPFRILYHIGGKGPHYHVYLLGRKNGCFTLPT